MLPPPPPVLPMNSRGRYNLTNPGKSEQQRTNLDGIESLYADENNKFKIVFCNKLHKSQTEYCVIVANKVSNHGVF